MLKVKDELRRSFKYFIKKMPWVHQERIHYFYKFKKLPNILEPKLFNEKILYRKFISGDYTRYGRLSDKFLVRDYITCTIGKEYLVPLIYETDDPATLQNLASLNNTVIKPNHGSNMACILLHEPDTEQKQSIINRCIQWLDKDFSFEAREIHYRFIRPRILVEKYIGDGVNPPIDYKFHMFNKRNGEFEYVLQIIYNRHYSLPSMNFYVNNLSDAFHRIRDTGVDVSAINNSLSQALELSKTLAADFDYVRVDWYINEGHIYFGELTFTPGAGLVTGLDRGLNQIMGDMWIQDKGQLPYKDSGVQEVNIPVMVKKVI